MSDSLNNLTENLTELDVNSKKSPGEPEIKDSPVSTTSYSDIALEMQCEVVKNLDFKSRSQNIHEKLKK